MQKMNDFGFVLALLERSAIVVDGRETEADYMLDAATLEMIDAQILRERMLGLVATTLDEMSFGTIH